MMSLTSLAALGPLCNRTTPTKTERKVIRELKTIPREEHVPLLAAMMRCPISPKRDERLAGIGAPSQMKAANSTADPASSPTIRGLVQPNPASETSTRANISAPTQPESSPAPGRRTHPREAGRSGPTANRSTTMAMIPNGRLM